MLVNELDPDRAARLELGKRYEVTQLDATSQEWYDKLKGFRPDRLVANPPFGTVYGPDGQPRQFKLINPGTFKDTTRSVDLAIALNSLDTMTHDGKATIVIGAKTGTASANISADAKARAKDYNRPEFVDIFSRFNVVDWFTLGGDLYEKMGAGWPVDVIVIDGKHPTPRPEDGGMLRPWQEAPRVLNSWNQAEDLLPHQDHERRHDDNTGTGDVEVPPGGSGGGSFPT